MDETGVTLVSSIRRCPCPCIINNSPDSFTLASLLAPSLISSHLASPRLTSFRLASRLLLSRRREEPWLRFFETLVVIIERGTYNPHNSLRKCFKYLLFSTICAGLRIPAASIYSPFLCRVPRIVAGGIDLSIIGFPCALVNHKLRRTRFTKPRDARERSENRRKQNSRARPEAARRRRERTRPRSRVFSRMISRTGVCTWHSSIITDRMYQTRNQEWIIAEPRLLPALNRAQQCQRITSSDPAVDDVC